MQPGSKDLLALIPHADWLLCRLLRLDSVDHVEPNSLTLGEWESIARRASSYNLASLLYSRMKAIPGWAGFPEHVQAKLRAIHIHSSARDMARRHRLHGILQTFHANNLSPILLKGAFLAEAIYLDPAERPMDDTDLLFKLTDLEPAAKVLRTMGFQPRKEYWVDEEIQASHELPTFFQSGYPAIELHWTLITPSLPFQIDLKGLWQRACPATVAGVSVLGLSPEDLTLHLCIHAATQHRLRDGLRLTYDIAACLAHYQRELDWSALERRARQWKAQRAVYLMLRLAHEIFGAPIPTGALAALEPADYDPALFGLAVQLIFQSMDQVPAFPPYLAELQQTGELTRRLRLVLERIFLTRSEIARRYPVRQRSWKVLLYYPLRWRDLWVSRVRMTWSIFRKDPNTVQKAELVGQRIVKEDHLIDWLIS